MHQPLEPTHDSATTGHDPRSKDEALSDSSRMSPLELCRRLEERGIEAWNQGEGLLDALRDDLRDEDERPAAGPITSPKTELGRDRIRSLLCTAESSELLKVLPRAVVTASDARRLILATVAGPVDLFPIHRDRLSEVLVDFGLGPLAIAYRPTTGQWCDPSDARQKFASGVLDLAAPTPNVFSMAPRRYWIGARLASQYALEPASEFVEAARDALPEVLDRLPTGAPARREISHILASPEPAIGLTFLRDSGLSHALFPGMKRASEKRVAELSALPALRWAAWLEGSALGRALIRLRVPYDLARSIERIRRAHPIDRTIESMRDAGVRKFLHQLGRAEIDGLFEWRRLELASAVQNEQTRARSKHLAEVEARLHEFRLARENSGRVPRLALDGKAVMNTLGFGPGPVVGRALKYLAEFVEANPGANEFDRLISQLRLWATKDLREAPVGHDQDVNHNHNPSDGDGDGDEPKIG